MYYGTKIQTKRRIIMKKIISLMLVLVMCVFAFVSCGECDTCVDADNDGKCDNCGKDVEPSAEAKKAAWDAAWDFSNVTVEMHGEETDGTYTEEYDYLYRFVQGTVFMSRDVGDEDVYTFAHNDKNVLTSFDFSAYYDKFTEANGKYTAASVDVTAYDETMTVTDVEITITDGKVTALSYGFVDEYDGQTATMTMTATFKDYGTTEVPADVVAMDYDNYEDADIGDLVIVEAYVQATQSWWSNKITVYLADHDGAYFAYEMACTEADAAKLTPGTMIRIVGTKAEWAGEVEITDCTFTFVEDADTYIAEPVDLTDVLGTDELIDYQNQLAKFTDMTVKSVEYKNGTPGDDIYVTFTKGGADYSFCVEYYLNGSDADFYGQFATLAAGVVVAVEGFVYWYNGINTHITKITKE